MPNFLESMRLRNLFNPSPGGLVPNELPPNMQFPQTDSDGGNPFQNINFGSTNPSIPSMGRGTNSPEIPYDIMSRMKELYHPTNDASQRFEGLVNQYPQRENPSLIRRLGSMIVDYTKGPQAGQEMMDQPFNEKLTDWKNKIGPTQNAANLERYENTNDRTMAYQTISAELRDHAQAAKERNDEAKMKIAQHRADVYDFKARNPSMKIVSPEGGNVFAINPLTGEKHDLGIPTGSLTATDKLNLQHENRIEEIGATGNQNRQTEQVRQTGRETIAESRGWKIYNVPDPTNPGQTKAVKINEISGEVRDIKQDGVNTSGVAKPSSAGGMNKPESSTQNKIHQFNIARQLKNSRPDLAPFIELGSPGPNDFTITPNSKNTGVKGYIWGGSSGPTEKQFKEINDAIFGTGGITPVASHELSTSVKVKSPDGRTGTFKGTETEAIAAGYQVVK